MSEQTKAKLTKRLVDSLKPEATEYSVSDTALPGFVVRVFPTGIKSFAVRYRHQGGARRYSLGKYGELTVEQARQMAQDKLSETRQGKDPSQARRTLREAPTLGEFAQDYMEGYAKAHKRPGTIKNDESSLRRHILPKLGRKKLKDIQRRDIETLHRSMKDTPYQANRVVALLSHMLRIAIEQGYRPDNPAQGIKKFHEEKRTDWLHQEALERLYAVLSTHENQQAVDAVQVLLATGSRKQEALRMEWKQVSFEQQQWTKPSAHTKQKQEHITPLDGPTLLLLSKIKEQQETEGIDTPYVFPSPVKKGRPLGDLKRFWKSATKAANLEGVRIHDLRHTFGSILASRGESLYVIGKLLGHTQASTTQRYAHLANDPLKEALKKNTEALEAAQGKTRERAEIIPLRSK